MPRTHSLRHTGAYPALPVLEFSHLRGKTSSRPRKRERNKVTFSALDSAVVVATSPTICGGGVGCISAVRRSLSCSSVVRTLARSRSSSARRLSRSVISLLLESSTAMGSHVFIKAPRIHQGSSGSKTNVRGRVLRNLVAKNNRRFDVRSISTATNVRVVFTAGD